MGAGTSVSTEAGTSTTRVTSITTGVWVGTGVEAGIAPQADIVNAMMVAMTANVVNKVLFMV